MYLPRQPTINMEGETEMKWFVKTSYGYINPRGLIEHVIFAYRLPKAWMSYSKIMRREKALADMAKLDQEIGAI